MKPRKRKPKAATPIALWVPASFDARSMLPADMLPFTDQAYYLLDLILRKRMSWKASADGFVPLQAQLLRKQLGHRLSLPLIETLERIKVIERFKKANGEPHYLAGRECIRYRMLPPYATDDVHRVWLTDQHVLKTLSKWRSEAQCPKSDVHEFLDYWVRHTGIQITTARRVVRRTPRLARDEAVWNGAIDMITSRDCPTSVCRMGRYHSIFTRTPREFRSCITVDRVMEPLASVDVANCQPLMIALVVGMYAAQKDLRARLRMGKLFKSARPNPYTAVAGNKRTKADASAPVFILRAENGELRQLNSDTGVASPPACMEKDALLYLEHCEAGTIYEALQRDLRVTDRDTVKQCFVKMAGKPKWSRRFDSRFAKLYPSVARVMRRIQKKNHRQLARLTQNIEATLVIDRAARRLMELRDPDMPIITVHDGIFTRPQFLPLVEEVLTGVFREVGLSVRLKRDRLAAAWSDGQKAPYKK